MGRRAQESNLLYLGVCGDGGVVLDLGYVARGEEGVGDEDSDAKGCGGEVGALM
jgi:hypothetical protein